MKTRSVSIWIKVRATIVVGLLGVAAPARAKTLIDYFLPTPIVCPLTSNTWGAAGVVPRDVCNGLEDSTGKTWQYWDGKILQGSDGHFHIYAGEWPQNKGFADWPNSVIVEGVSNGTVVGSYISSTTTPFTGKEQNVTGIVQTSGSFALLDSPGKIYTAPSLTGPWTSQGTIQVTANGSTISTATTENQSIWQSADATFLIISRTFQEMVSSKNILGPYVIQATIPSLQSQGYEDPVVWCSGGQYHLVANMYNARKANHFTSADGIHNWTNMGLAYDPTSNFVRYTDGTVNHWYKAERPGVFLQNGHVTAFTFAVIDVDKTLDLANDNHGSKIIVVPFDGVAFDHDNPGPGSVGCPADGGGTGSGGSTGSGGVGGGGGTGGRTNTGGASGKGGAGGVGGTGGAAGESGPQTGGGDGQTGGAGSGGTSNGSGGSGMEDGSGGSGTGGTPVYGSGGTPATGSGGSGTAGTGGGPSSTGQGGAAAGTNASGGCSCGIGGEASRGTVAASGMLFLVGVAVWRRRKRTR